MASISIGDTIALFGLFSGLASALWMMVGAYHANKRDLAHVKRNTEQFKQAFLDQGKSIDQLEIDVSELRTIINFLLADRGDTHSGILGHKPQGRR
jgi:hypothetical protein